MKLEKHETARIYSTVKFADTVEDVRMEQDTFIGDYCFISVPILYMARGSQVNSGTRIVGRQLVSIGKNSVVSYCCTLITTSDTSHGRDMNDASSEEDRDLREGHIDIGPRVFIGAHSILMPGVIIAPGVVIRAFSYVNQSFTHNDGIYGGQPAKLIAHRSYR